MQTYKLSKKYCSEIKRWQCKTFMSRQSLTQRHVTAWTVRWSRVVYSHMGRGWWTMLSRLVSKVVTRVNFIKSGTLLTAIFKNFFRVFETENGNRTYFCEFSWLRTGRFYDPGSEMMTSQDIKGITDIPEHIKDGCSSILASLVNLRARLRSELEVTKQNHFCLWFLRSVNKTFTKRF